MIATTPALRGIVKEARSRDGGNSLLIREFPGRILFLTGSNSATGVKSMPIRWLFCDEIDEYPGDVDGQGDPIALAEKRTTGPTYPRGEVLLVSTPTIKGLSPIDREFLASDQRRYFAPCPHCGSYDWIRWGNIRWTEGDPKSAALTCVAWGALIEELHKTEMLARGEWRATAKGRGETAGFRLSSLYSPLGWLPCSAAVSEFLEAKEDPVRSKNWVNSVLGEDLGGALGIGRAGDLDRHGGTATGALRSRYSSRAGSAPRSEGGTPRQHVRAQPMSGCQMARDGAQIH
jgi:phage terminase large subunit GpA-like protein